jgi:hypothetical protein
LRSMTSVETQRKEYIEKERHTVTSQLSGDISHSEQQLGCKSSHRVDLSLTTNTVHSLLSWVEAKEGRIYG